MQQSARDETLGYRSESHEQPTGALWQLRNATESSRGGVDLSMDTLDVNRRAFWMLFNPIMDGSSGVSGRSSEKSLDEGLEASLSPVHSIAALLH